MKMKKNFKLMLFALAAMTAGFTSCSNEGDENLATGGDKGKIAFSFSPVGLATRAIDLNHTASESAVTNVTLFVYKADGTLERIDDFVAATDLTLGGAIWSLNAGKEVEVTTGNKNVYVGVNMPASLVNAIRTNAGAGMSMTSAYNEALATMTTPNNFTMFSDAAATVNVTVAGPNNASNITVSRLAAKVSVKYDNTIFTGASVNVAGGTIQLSSLEWAVENQNPAFRILQPDGTTSFSPSWTWSAPPSITTYQAIAGDNPGGAPAVDANAVYVMENIPNTAAASPLSDVVTYVRIRCDFTPSLILDGTGASVGPGTPGTTFYTVPNPSGGVAYFATQAHAVAWSAANASGAPETEYLNGECDYGIFINKTAGAYDVVRNHYYAVTIQAINGIGVPANPNIPIVPTAKGKLSFNLTVNDWVDNSSKEQI